MTESAIYVLAGVGLAFANTLAWVASWFGMPGTWVIVALTALACHFFPSQGMLGLSWGSVGVLAGLAVLGEVLETAASAASTRKAGGSRRGAVFAMMGAIAGSLVGAFMGIPIPVVGPMIAAVVGAAAGAFGGAWIGEGRFGHTIAARLAISRAAATGRVWGTVGKLAVGLLMVTFATAAFFL
ncbi:MAG: DUF456 domain-containing protein [Planctomyces sp.]|nr:DUF456 domain-containing protein [Planctomyces sp.]